MAKKEIRITSPEMPPIEEYIAELRDIWESKQLTNTGAKHIELEAKLAEYLGVPGLSLFANGHMSIEMAIAGLELSGEIITTPFTFVSTMQAVLRNGIKPVFCDIREDDYTIDTERIEELITDRTTAILPVHVYGNPCDMEEIQKIADAYHLKVLYDAAHAFGVRVDGKGIAAFGDMSMLSFHATKVFNSVEGGAAAYRDTEFFERFRALKQFGMKLGTDEVPYVGANAKMSELHAAMGLCNLRYIDEYINRRELLVKRYRENLEGIEGVVLCEEKENVKYNYAYFPVVFQKEVFGKSRDDVLELLERENIYARKYFYPLNCDFACYRERFGGDKTAVPVARRISESVLTLPLYSGLEISDVDRVCDIIRSGRRGGKQL